MSCFGGTPSLAASPRSKVKSPAGMSGTDLLDHAVMIDQGFGYPAIE
jgi:hypothetical protein